MRKAQDLTEIMNFTYASKFALTQKAINAQKPVQVVLHWTAGRYSQFFDDYHINIDYDGSYYLSTTDFSEIKYHNYMKNSGSIGICLCCAYGADTYSLGDYAPTDEQIEACAKLMAVLSEALGTELDVEHFCTHGESSDNEDFDFFYPDYTGYPNNTYGPKSDCERWDLEYLDTPDSPSFNPHDEAHRGGTVLRNKAKKYRMSFYGH